MANVKITVTRAFWHAGESHDIGSTLEVPAALATELISYGKAEVAAEKPVKGKKDKQDEPV